MQRRQLIQAILERLGNAAGRSRWDSPATYGSTRSIKATWTASKACNLNLVDEVTQFQFIGSVEHIHASCLAPVLEALLRAFPFTLHGFHADNGAEFINRNVATLLQALHIDTFTKSRARRSTDNALVESKNGSVVRKHLGYGHIPSRYAERVNTFNQQILSPYLTDRHRVR